MLLPSSNSARALLGVILLWTASCTEEPRPGASDELHENVRFLRGALVSEAGLHFVPDRYWTPRLANGAWSFRVSAGFLCEVREQPTEDLVLHVRPSRITSRCHFTASWDTETKLLEPQRIPQAGLTIRVPAEHLTPGLHKLRLDRVRTRDTPKDAARRDMVFEMLAFGLGEPKDELRVAKHEQYRYTSDFLSYGLTGSAPRRVEGCLFVGPAEHTAWLALERPGVVQFELENHSEAPAEFELEIGPESGSVSVEPNRRQRLTVDVTPGQHRLAMRVGGVEDGLFLWGAPYLHEKTETLPGPVIVISMDTTRRDALTPYGAPAEASPHIQEFAEHATTYDNCYAVSPWTLPSHASMFTGLYPSHHGAGVIHDRLKREHVTLAELYAEAGYFTAGFVAGALCASKRGVAQGFLTYRDPEGSETRARRLTNAVEATLRSQRDKPLFLFINYFDPHALYLAPPRFAGKFDVPRLREKIADQPLWMGLAKGNEVAWSAIKSGKAKADADALAFLRAVYLAEVAYMDDQIGRVFRVLKELDLYDSALIMLTSDHGEMLGENGYFSHSNRLFPELVEIPLLIKAPGQTAPRRLPDLVSHVDVFPTLLERVLGTSPPSDGVALGVPDTQERLAGRASVFMEEHNNWFHPLNEYMKLAPHLFGVQRLNYREVVWRGGIKCERRDADGWVTATCESEWMKRMEELAAWMRLRPADPGDEAQNEGRLSEEDEARLRSLGYVK